MKISFERSVGFVDVMKTTSCLRISIAGMVMTGVWLPEKFDNNAKRVYYYLYAFSFQFLLFYGMIAIEFAGLFQVSIGNIDYGLIMRLDSASKYNGMSKFYLSWKCIHRSKSKVRQRAFFSLA